MEHEHTFDPMMRATDWQRFWRRQLEREAQIRSWLDRLELGPGDRFVDVGSGPGLASLLAADRVGPEGRVVSIDTNAEALKLLRGQARERGLDRIETYLADAGAMPLPGQSFTHALAALVLHHLADPARAAAEIFRVLAPGGRVLVSDYRPDADPSVGPPAQVRVGADQTAARMTAAGFFILAQGETEPYWFFVLGEVPG